MPDLDEITRNFAIEPSEGLVNKTNPLKLFYKVQGALPPGARGAVGGVIGGLGGYYGSKALTNMAISLMFANKSPEERSQMMGGIQGNNNLSRIGAIIGALGGLYFGGGRDLDFKDWASFKQSFKDPNYWKQRNPLENRVNKFNTQLDDKWHQTKLASEMFDNSYRSDIIPISSSMDLINNDTFLNPFQKNETNNLIFGAENKDTGLTSGQKLTRSALKAGIGFVPAYGFGKVVGGVLGLPPPVRTRLGMVGGLAAAVMNSGILTQGA